MNARAAPPWSVGLLLWLAFLPGPVRFSARDNIPTQLLTESLLAGHGFDLTSYYPSPLPRDVTQLVRNGERLVSKFPSIHALTSLPVAVAVRALEPDLQPEERSRITGRAAAALFTAAALAVTYAVLLRLTGPATSLALTLSAAFASPLYSVASRELWTHGPAALLLATVVWLSYHKERNAVIGAAACVTALYFVRHAAFIPAIVLFLTLQRDAIRSSARRDLLLGMLYGFIAASLPLALLNLATVGNPIGAYVPFQMFEYPWGPPRLQAILAYSISPGRGMVLFAPITLLALVGLFRAGRRAEGRMAWACAGAVATALVQISSLGPWWGGWAFGPRLLTEYVPLLTIMAASCPPRVIALGCALCLPAAGIHAAYVFKGGQLWDTRRQVDTNPTAVWDLRDSPITDLVVGPPRPDPTTLDARRLTLPTGPHPIGSESPTPWLAYGWEAPERDGAWAVGDETWLAMSLPGPGQYTLSLSAAAPALTGRTQRLELRLGDRVEHVAYTFRSGLWDYESVTLAIPYRPGVIVVRIRPAHIWFPGHGDVRRCTFFLRALSLERLESEGR